MFDFKGKVAVVTGASGIGIGREIAERFHEAGARLAICSRSQARIDAAAREIAGDRADDILAMEADMSSIEDIHAFIDAAAARFGRIDILINNAGVQFPKPSLEVTEEDWRRTVDTNLRGCFFAAKGQSSL